MICIRYVSPTDAVRGLGKTLLQHIDHTKDDFGKFVLYMLAQALANFVAMVYAFTGGRPPRVMLIGGSLGDAISPFAWQMYRNTFGYPKSEDAEEKHDIL